MGSTYGRQQLDQVGVSITLSADAYPEMKPGGVTIDWSTVAAVGADTTVDDGVFIPSGEKYLRYGQTVARIVAVGEVQTLTVTGTPTGGNVTIQGIRPDGNATATGTIAFNSSAAAAQTVADTIFGIGNVTVGGGALPGTALTFTFRGDWDPQLMTVTANAGQFGPYDPAASDGRQTLTQGDCFLLNETVRETGDPHSNHPQALQGGLVWKARLLATSGTHTLAAGPTLAEVLAAFPRLRLAKM